MHIYFENAQEGVLFDETLVHYYGSTNELVFIYKDGGHSTIRVNVTFSSSRAVGKALKFMSNELRHTKNMDVPLMFVPK